MAGAMISMSDSLHASLIIHHQLKQQLRESQGTKLSYGEEPVKKQPRPQKGQAGYEAVKHEEEEAEEEEERGVGLCDQLMLVSALFGIEMCMSFEQIYEILFLQFLGVPLALVSVSGVIAGCFGMIFLPVVGAWTDRGPNPKARKLYSLFAGLLVFGSGLLILIGASFLKIQQLNNVLDEVYNQANQTPLNDLDLSPDLSERVENKALYNTTDHGFILASSTLAPKDTANVTESILDYTSLPGIVFISILGFAGLDMGFDVTVSLSRALILENVPSFQHMRVLVLATVVQSSAGTTCSLIGCFDLPRFLGSAFKTDGTAATLVFFCCILLTASLIGFFLMGLASYRLGRAKNGLAICHVLPHKNNSHQLPGVSNSFNNTTINSGESDVVQVKPCLVRQKEGKRKISASQLEHLQEERTYVPDILHTEEGDASTRPLVLEDSLKINYCAINMAVAIPPQDDQEKGFTTGNIHADYSNTPVDSADISSDVEKLAEISASLPAKSTTQSKAFDITGVSTVINTIRQSYSMSISQRGGLGDFHARKLSQLHAAESILSAKKMNEAHRRLRTRLVILCVSSFFAIGASMSFSVYSSNTFNLGILHGDPTALPGTEGRENYERGLQLGAIGNFIMYCSFMAVSVTNNKIIELIGERGQYTLFHVLLIVSLLTIICTKLVEVYFVFMVFCGAFRTCMLTLPFVMAHKFTQEGLSGDTVNPEQKMTYTGRVMTLIGFLIPTHFLILSIIMGPMMEVTGNPWVPLYYCLASCSTSVGVFSLLFFV